MYETTSVPSCTDPDLPSLEALCNAFAITTEEYLRRKNAGLSPKDCLSADPDEIVTDHLGNSYPSVRALCDAYGITPAEFIRRLCQNGALSDALTGMPSSGRKGPSEPEGLFRSKTVVTDHNGVEYPSITALCKAYGVVEETFRRRRMSGWSLKECLLGRNNVYDHLGNAYPSIAAMCRAYHISGDLFNNRKKKGWPLEECLLGKQEENAETCSDDPGETCTDGPGETCTDDLGFRYDSLAQMCRAHGVAKPVFLSRRASGLPLSECLKSTSAVCDHLGNTYPTLSKMCEHYGVIEATFLQRMNRGLSLEDCLTGEKHVTDHLGNKFRSIREMCDFYGISRNLFSIRKQKGLSLEECLTGEKHVTDHLGNCYSSVEKMCSHYGITVHTYQIRMRRGASQEEALTKRLAGPYRNYRDAFGVVHRIKNDLYQYYRISYATYHNLLREGLSEKEVLLWKPDRPTYIDDHVMLLEYAGDYKYTMQVDGNTETWTFSRFMKYLNDHEIRLSMHRSRTQCREPEKEYGSFES